MATPIAIWLGCLLVACAYLRHGFVAVSNDTKPHVALIRVQFYQNVRDSKYLVGEKLLNCSEQERTTESNGDLGAQAELAADATADLDVVDLPEQVH